MVFVDRVVKDAVRRGDRPLPPTKPLPEEGGNIPALTSPAESTKPLPEEGGKAALVEERKRKKKENDD